MLRPDRWCGINIATKHRLPIIIGTSIAKAVKPITKKCANKNRRLRKYQIVRSVPSSLPGLPTFNATP